MSLVAAVLFALVPVVAAATPARDPIESCDDSFDVDTASEAYTSYRCYYMAARGGASWAAVDARLAALAPRPVDGGWALLMRAHMASDQGEEVAVDRYREAMARFAADGEPLGEVYARVGLATWYAYDHAWDTVFPLLDEAEAIAGKAGPDLGDPFALTTVLANRARFLHRAGQPDRALALLEPLSATVFPDGPYQLKLLVLHVLATATHDTGRFAASYDATARQAALTREAGDHYVAATATANQLALLTEAPGLLERVGRNEALRLAEVGLEEARLGRNRFSEAGLLFERGLLLGKEGRSDIEHAIEVYRELDYLSAKADLYGALALTRFPDDAAAALADVQTGLALAARDEDAELLDQQLRFVRAFLRWQLGDRDAARAESEALLESIETRRDRTWDPTAQAWVQSVWGAPYAMLASELARDGDPAAAFVVMERLRGHSLLASMAQARVALPADAAPLRVRHQEALAAVSAAQRALMAEGLDDAARSALQQSLEEAEAAVFLARDDLARIEATLTGVRTGAPVELAEVQAALGHDEAMVVYHLSRTDRAIASAFPDWSTPAWALVIRPDQATVVWLPQAPDVDGAVASWHALVRRRDGSGHAVSASLHATLVAPVLAALPPTVDSLIVVPEGALHRLPWADLRASPDADPLVATHRLALAPSATAWLTLHGRRGPLGGQVLALADPLLERSGPAGDPTASWTSRLAASLPPLPAAAGEAGAAVAAGGAGSRVYSGAAASEKALVDTDWTAPALVHFAVHAILDPDHPDRSALVLTPDGAASDGLLQVREIAELPLRGQVAVLSACSTGTGTELGGEGVLGLGRAWFQAGGRAVVGTLWPLRDDDAAALFERFYDHLGDGLPVADALALAQRDRWAGGAPSEAWAGVVVTGDGAAAPLPARRRWWSLWWAMAEVGGLGLLLWRGLHR